MGRYYGQWGKGGGGGMVLVYISISAWSETMTANGETTQSPPPADPGEHYNRAPLSVNLAYLSKLTVVAPVPPDELRSVGKWRKQRWIYAYRRRLWLTGPGPALLQSFPRTERVGCMRSAREWVDAGAAARVPRLSGVGTSMNPIVSIKWKALCVVSHSRGRWLDR